ncbi:MerR family transcriptional regulator [Flavobacterium akiainvivens]|uniref:MerR family transcriptional regulator n=1 Tax=Flavobacterium akiainvivens TaxID=1202724 RepID=A0A0M9VJM5_9FLAO|nr:MerR family transcriptional regulator [Flavobacterium akiainvivens]KOS07919.1 MerR family transcriptional regulator [Flavobacterium akiainvivens]SFQ28850.1 B12 binding domain-containing protein [Flavobacterium akiainvivens]
MNKTKSVFNIKDLENLTGIKAHTIRIWEKRYSILTPERGDNNTRVYDTHALQKLLNINTLNKFGYKISVIAKMEESKIPLMVREILSKKTVYSHAINSFKVAMMNFDVPLFFSTYNALLTNKSFRDIFYDCFLPLLEEIGALWQTDTITSAHEHFICSLIKQKIASNTEVLQEQEPAKTDRTFVLYLPDDEIHEIGLLFINYELLHQGFKTVYIGESIPVESLADTNNYFDNITFVTYLTINPEPALVSPYVKALKESLLLEDKENELYFFGRNTMHISPSLLDEKISTFNDIRKFAEELHFI